MTQTLLRSVGSYLPPKILTNTDLEKTLDTSDEWITERTGIKQRHIAEDGVVTSDLACEAAQRAIDRAGIEPGAIDVIIVATATPDETMPSTATRVQHKLGIRLCAAFDVNAACSGFVYGVSIADSMLKYGQGRTALVIGAETLSRVTDWTDRSTAILFGDGAGAVVIEASDDAADAGRGVLYNRLYSAGEHGDLLGTNAGVSSTQTAGLLTMQGREVFKHGVTNMAECVSSALKALHMSLSDIDYLVPHQANGRMLTKIAKRLDLQENQVVSTVENHGNTSAASIPLALDVMVQEKKLTKDKILALTALGSGLTWGCNIIKW